MDFMFSWQELYLTRSLRTLVRYSSCHSNIKSISSRHRVISSIYGTRAMLVLNLPAFENKKYAAYNRFHGNGPYGEILTMKEPIKTLGFTSRLPCHTINHVIFTCEDIMFRRESSPGILLVWICAPHLVHWTGVRNGLQTMSVSFSYFCKVNHPNKKICDKRKVKVFKKNYTEFDILAFGDWTSCTTRHWVSAVLFYKMFLFVERVGGPAWSADEAIPFSSFSIECVSWYWVGRLVGLKKETFKKGRKSCRKSWLEKLTDDIKRTWD